MEKIASAYEHTYHAIFNQEHNNSSLPVAGKKIKAVTSSEKTTFNNQLNPEKTKELTLEEWCVKQFEQGKAVAKMLSGYRKKVSMDGSPCITTYSDRLEKELDELMELEKSGKYLKVSSTTLMIPQKPQEFYRNFGFILDVNKCVVKAAYIGDAMTYRMDDTGDAITWDSQSKKYIKEGKDPKSEPVEFSGKFGSPDPALDNLKELLTLSYTLPYRNSGCIEMNEVVVNYNRNSIIGLIATNGPTVLNSAADNLTIKKLDMMTFKSDCFMLKAKVTSTIGVDLPLFLYDDQKGKISLL